jgi:hypothetical protein
MYLRITPSGLASLYPAHRPPASGMASEPASSARPTRYKDALISRRFPTVLFIPFFPSLSCAGPRRASGLRELHQAPCRALVCAQRYDLASERGAPVRPPVLIRQMPRQHFLVDHLAVGLPLTMTPTKCLAFQTIEAWFAPTL